MKTKSIFFGIALLSLGIVDGRSQTTLSGDHVITGDLNVGTTGTSGNLEVTGETGNAAAPGIKVTGDGGVVFEGTHGAGLIPATGAGTRFMWYPKKSALRAGMVWGTEWDDINIGEYSVALGASSATGSGATAVGYSWSGGFGSFSSGNGFAGGSSSIAMGATATAINEADVALGYFATASGGSSFAFGDTVESSGYGAFGAGMACSALGESSIAMGYSSIASGYASVALGEYVSAAGYASSANGFKTIANSAYCFVVGRNNAINAGENLNNWVDTDSLFVIGNGTGNSMDAPETKNRNAFVVYKNGDARFTKRQGDILMGEFGNPE